MIGFEQELEELLGVPVELLAIGHFIPLSETESWQRRNLSLPRKDETLYIEELLEAVQRIIK